MRIAPGAAQMTGLEAASFSSTVGGLARLLARWPVLPLVVLILAMAGCSGETGDDDDGTAGDDDASQTGTPLPTDGDGDGAVAAVDCNDADASIYPGAEETCDGVDEDCDDSVDEDASGPDVYADEDDDGFGAGAPVAASCDPPTGYVINDQDCDDTDPDVHPGASEACNSIDDDCDDNVDEGAAETWYSDFDGDGYGNPEVPTEDCVQPPGYVTNDDDCDDTDAAVNPDAEEHCNQKDDNCNGRTDENAKDRFYADEDGDGYGDPLTVSLACPAPPGYVDNNQDCNDDDPDIHPGVEETCDGVDEDCDHEIDEGYDRSVFFADVDADTYGDPDAAVDACQQPDGYVTDDNDCDDAAADVYPGAPEQCNSIDDDCDGEVDEEVQNLTFYADEDGDGYGNIEVPLVDCAAPDGYVLNSTDCNDEQASIYPGAAEACNSIDDDCDGEVDETGDKTWYADADGDGYGDASSSQKACDQPEGYVSSSTDCDDTDAGVHPGVKEACNFKDDNCNEQVDEGIDVLQVAAGEVHSLALCSDGTVIAWGYNGSGQLGDGTFENRSTPVTVKLTGTVVAIGTGYQHSLAIKSDGSAWAWGYNGAGQLGDGTKSSRPVPVRVQLDSDPASPDNPPAPLGDVSAVAGGADHSVFLRKDGSVYATGDGSQGQLGVEGISASRLTIQVTALSGVKAIAAGGYHALVVDGTGGVLAWGANSYGQLGDGSTENRTSPVVVTGLSGVSRVAAGQFHSLALGTDGSLRAWGRGDYGQLASGTASSSSTPLLVDLTGVTRIGAGFMHSLAALDDGSLWSWGANFGEQLGVESADRCGPSGVPEDEKAPCALEALEVGDFGGVVGVGGGYVHSILLDAAGAVWTWGDNNSGQLGDGTTDPHATPEIISEP